MFHKTVGSPSPDEKYNLLAGEGGVGSVASGAAVAGLQLLVVGDGKS